MGRSSGGYREFEKRTFGMNRTFRVFRTLIRDSKKVLRVGFRNRTPALYKSGVSILTLRTTGMH